MRVGSVAPHLRSRTRLRKRSWPPPWQPERECACPRGARPGGAATRSLRREYLPGRSAKSAQHQCWSESSLPFTSVVVSPVAPPRHCRSSSGTSQVALPQREPALHARLGLQSMFACAGAVVTLFVPHGPSDDTCTEVRALHPPALMNVPRCNSSKATRNSSWVFITIGPYQATGSPIGIPEINRKRTSVCLRW